MSEFPKVFRLRQKFATTRVENVEAETEHQLARLQLARRVSPGQTVAITAGSRGIANIHLITRAVVRHSGPGRAAVSRARHGQPRRRHG